MSILSVLYLRLCLVPLIAKYIAPKSSKSIFVSLGFQSDVIAEPDILIHDESMQTMFRFCLWCFLELG